jgi:hypothetical protein
MTTDHRRLLDDVVAHSPRYPDERFAGRGVVICAGGSRLLTCAWVNVCMLRQVLRCNLPIQLWHLGPGELGPFEAALFGELGVDTIDAHEVRRAHPMRTLGGWELKPYALINSSFREVVLLDADNVPVVDPGSFLDSAPFRETGAVFWPDFDRLRDDNPVWELCRVDYRAEPAFESGQMVIDKARCWDALQVTLHMNAYSDTFYRHIHGDKETFYLAWRRVDLPYAMPSHRPSLTPVGLCQYDFDGHVAFQHRNIVKWSLHGDNPRSTGFLYEDECFGFLDDLRSRWLGVVQATVACEPSDAVVEGALREVRWFQLARDDGIQTLVELLVADRVGVGRETVGMRWHVEDGRLTFEGRDGPTYRLQPHAGGGWEGTGPAGSRVMLRPQLAVDGGSLGGHVAVLLDRLVASEALDADDVVSALVTIARVVPLEDTLARARSGAAGNLRVDALIGRALMALGRRDPSSRLRTTQWRHRYEGHEPFDP